MPAAYVVVQQVSQTQTGHRAPPLELKLNSRVRLPSSRRSRTIWKDCAESWSLQLSPLLLMDKMWTRRFSALNRNGQVIGQSPLLFSATNQQLSSAPLADIRSSGRASYRTLGYNFIQLLCANRCCCNRYKTPHRAQVTNQPTPRTEPFINGYPWQPVSRVDSSLATASTYSALIGGDSAVDYAKIQAKGNLSSNRLHQLAE